MTRHVQILRCRFSYAGGLVLHTASSGAVPVLEELRLLITGDAGLCAVGASRINIAYLSGLAPEAIEQEVLAAAAGLDWSLPFAALIPALDAAWPALSAPARMLFEMAAQDGAARAAGVPLWHWLGGSLAPDGGSTPTNQSLFWTTDDDMLDRAADYVRRGFTDIKLRIGIGDFADDLRRFRLLRERLGPSVVLAADANGRWTAAEALPRLVALGELGCRYVEQPLAATAWAETARVAAASPVPVMLDETLASVTAAARMAVERTAPLAHLKLAKLGGLDRLVSAGRRLAQAGIGVMAGQMNEGFVSTAAIAHAAIALDAPYRELYGADRLQGDPAETGFRYADGRLHLAPGPGLGIAAHPLPDGAALLWETRTEAAS